MSEPLSTPTHDEDEIDLREIVRTLWAGKLIIVLSTVIAAVASVAYALLATEIFSSQASIQIRGEEQGGGLAAQLGGLANLAGVSVGGGDANREFALTALKSRAVIQRMIEEENLLPILYADNWDAEHKRWLEQDPKKIPTPWKAYDFFTKNILRISEDKKTGIVTTVIEWEDPQLAAAWVQKLINRVNAFVNDAAIREAEQNLRFLEEQTKTASVVELQQTIFSMMETEIKKLMVARNQETAALRVIDPPVVPERRIRPKRALIAILGTLLGGMFGVVAVFIRNAMRGWEPKTIQS